MAVVIGGDRVARVGLALLAAAGLVAAAGSPPTAATAASATVTLTVTLRARELGPDGRLGAPVSTTARVAAWYATNAGIVSPAIRGWAYPRLLAPDPRAIRYGYATGSFSVVVPRTAAVKLQVSRGPEYRPVATTLRPGTTAYTAILSRWIDEAAAGWYSGDDHVHLHYDNATSTPSSVRMTLADVSTMASGEDLRVTNLMVANTSGRKSGSSYLWDAALFGTQRTSGGRIVRVSQEVRHELSGHLVVLGGTRLATPAFAAEEGSTNPYLAPSDTSAIAALGPDPVVAYTHPTFGGPATYSGFFDRELPVTAAAGRLDGMDLLGPTTSEPNARAAYEDLLGAGIHLAALGGTDAELDAGPLDFRTDDRGNRVYDARQNPIGCDRMYVRVAGPLTYQAWLEGIRAGRTFVTNGPLLDLTVVDGAGSAQGIGGTAAFAAGGVITVRGRVRSLTPVSVTLGVGSGVGAPRTIAVTPAADGTFTATVHVDGSGWVTLKAEGRAATCDANTATYAYTSPVYLQVGDGRVANVDALEALADWTSAGVADLAARPAAAFAATDADAAKATIVEQWRTANAWYCDRLPADASHDRCVSAAAVAALAQADRTLVALRQDATATGAGSLVASSPSTVGVLYGCAVIRPARSP